jgi:multiple sugar transport system permease protein
VYESTAARWFRRVTLALIALFALFPLLIILLTTIKPLKDVQNTFQWIPSHITLAPYAEIWSTVPLLHYFVNSLIVSSSSTVVSVTLAVFAGYAISRFQFRGRRLFSLAVLSTQMFPGILFALPFAVWMLAGFFATIPRELEEAAMVDGTSHWGALFRIVLPLARPGIVAVAVFAFMTAWGEVLFASVLTTQSTRTLGIGLQEYATSGDTAWNQMMAAAVVVSAPVVVVFLALQRHLIRGLTSGSVKG